MDDHRLNELWFSKYCDNKIEFKQLVCCISHRKSTLISSLSFQKCMDFGKQHLSH